jgi:hypothetical protein
VPNGGCVRAVIDTNVLLSGLIWFGTPHKLIEQVRAGTLTLISSPALLAELADVASTWLFPPQKYRVTPIDLRQRRRRGKGHTMLEYFMRWEVGGNRCPNDLH